MKKPRLYIIYISLFIFHNVSTAHAQKCGIIFKDVRDGLELISHFTTMIDDHWASDGYHSSSYSDYFKELLPEGSISDPLFRINKSQNSPFLLPVPRRKL